MSKPFNALFDVDYLKGFAKNEAVEKIVGKRDQPGNVMPFDLPCELGYHCPVCEYEQVTDGNFDERLAWSEYNGFLFCYVCNKDYPSALCMPNIDKAIDIYLSTVQDAQKQSHSPDAATL